jgi:hypothetical protein
MPSDVGLEKTFGPGVFLTFLTEELLSLNGGDFFLIRRDMDIAIKFEWKLLFFIIIRRVQIQEIITEIIILLYIIVNVDNVHHRTNQLLLSFHPVEHDLEAPDLLHDPNDVHLLAGEGLGALDVSPPDALLCNQTAAAAVFDKAVKPDLGCLTSADL